MFALLAANDGNFPRAFWFIFWTMAIDATDGILARKLDVKKRLPNFDGSKLDDVVDVFTYIYVPAFIIWKLDTINPVFCVVPIIAGLYAYGQKEMKTEDDFFLGWPSLWNLVALYLYWLMPGEIISTILIVVPGILTFIPTRYLYPSKSKVFQKSSLILGIIWVAIVFCLMLQETPSRTGILASLFYPVFYTGASFYADWKIRQETKTRRTK